MTNEEFAEHLDVAVRTVAYWRARPEMVPRQGMQQILDVALERAPELARAQFQRLLAEHDGTETRSAAIVAASGDPARLTEWLTATEHQRRGDRRHGPGGGRARGGPHADPGRGAADRRPPATGQRSSSVLADGRLRHRQERELLRVNGEVLAHMSLLLSDLHASKPADDYGNAALLYLREAGASEATAWYVLAKNARWRHQYVARRRPGQPGPPARLPRPMTVQLACYEANASALAGDASRARAAMRHAEEHAAELPVPEVSSSPWSFPSERMTIFRLSVALHTGDLDGALLAASDVGTGLESGWAARSSSMGTDQDRRRHRLPAQGRTRRSGRAGPGRCWTCHRGCGSLP